MLFRIKKMALRAERYCGLDVGPGVRGRWEAGALETFFLWFKAAILLKTKDSARRDFRRSWYLAENKWVVSSKLIFC
jgi:hypothetical protein